MIEYARTIIFGDYLRIIIYGLLIMNDCVSRVMFPEQAEAGRGKGKGKGRRKLIKLSKTCPGCEKYTKLAYKHIKRAKVSGL